MTIAIKYLDLNITFFESPANEFTEFFFIVAVSKELFASTSPFGWRRLLLVVLFFL